MHFQTEISAPFVTCTYSVNKNNETFAIFTVDFGSYNACHCLENKKGVEPDVYRCKSDSYFTVSEIELAKLLWGRLGASPPHFLAVAIAPIAPMESAPMNCCCFVCCVRISILVSILFIYLSQATDALKSINQSVSLLRTRQHNRTPQNERI